MFAQVRDPESKVKNHRVPIIAMTPHALQEDKDRCIDAGMDDYIPKPISSKLITEAMKMETEVRAPEGGTVQAVVVKEGDAVSAGEQLAVGAVGHLQRHGLAVGPQRWRRGAPAARLGSDGACSGLLSSGAWGPRPRSSRRRWAARWIRR